MNKKVQAILVLDESGSMGVIKDKTISCVNEYINSLLPQGKMCHITLVKFRQDDISFICEDVPVKDVPKLDYNRYKPNGGTPLLDAVGKTIKATQAQIDKAKDKPDILFIVMTDGEENSSREYNQKQIIDMISEKEKVGWTFVYLGANQDSWASASGIGYASRGNVLDFVASDNGMEKVMSRTIGATAKYFSGRKQFYATHALAGHDLDKVSYSTKTFYGKNKKEGGKYGKS
jgi:Mg-chelatase subunit ChlD